MSTEATGLLSAARESLAAIARPAAETLRHPLGEFQRATRLETFLTRARALRGLLSADELRADEHYGAVVGRAIWHDATGDTQLVARGAGGVVDEHLVEAPRPRGVPLRQTTVSLDAWATTMSLFRGATPGGGRPTLFAELRMPGTDGDPLVLQSARVAAVLPVPRVEAVHAPAIAGEAALRALLAGPAAPTR